MKGTPIAVRQSYRTSCKTTGNTVRKSPRFPPRLRKRSDVRNRVIQALVRRAKRPPLNPRTLNEAVVIVVNFAKAFARFWTPPK